MQQTTQKECKYRHDRVERRATGNCAKKLHHIDESESYRENETHKNFWDFEVQSLPSRFEEQNKKNLTYYQPDFAVHADHREKV